MIENKVISFIGAGKMGTVLIDGILKMGVVSPEKIIATRHNKDKLAELNKEYFIHTISLQDNKEANIEAVAKGDIIILAVKPQKIFEVLDEVSKAIDGSKVLISIAAGISSRLIEARLNKGVHFIRAMPNTPAQALAGVTAISKGKYATQEDVDLAKEIFESVGKVVEIDEELMDAVTGLSGSGPAYIYLIIEALSDGGVKMGLPREISLVLAAQTVLGAAKMVLETGKHPGELKDMVTSPSGTTIFGIHALEEGSVRGALIRAVEEATKRSKEIREELEKEGQ